MLFQIETTDTFGGEANYCWVNRHEFNAPDDIKTPQLIRLAKKAAEITARHKTTDFGDEIWLDYPGHNVRSFITFIETID